MANWMEVTITSQEGCWWMNVHLEEYPGIFYLIYSIPAILALFALLPIFCARYTPLGPLHLLSLLAKIFFSPPPRSAC